MKIPPPQWCFPSNRKPSPLYSSSWHLLSSSSDALVPARRGQTPQRGLSLSLTNPGCFPWWFLPLLSPRSHSILSTARLGQARDGNKEPQSSGVAAVPHRGRGEHQGFGSVSLCTFSGSGTSCPQPCHEQSPKSCWARAVWPEAAPSDFGGLSHP